MSQAQAEYQALTGNRGMEQLLAGTKGVKDYQVTVGSSTTGWSIGKYLTSSTAVRAMSTSSWR